MKMEKSRLLHGIFALLFGLLTIFGNGQLAGAASILDSELTRVPAAGETVDSKYSFIATFNDSKTTVNTFGDAKWRSLNDDGTLYDKGYSSDSFVFSPNEQSDPDSLKGKVGVIYTNVGNYDGKEIDLKVVLVDWDSTTDNSKIDGNIYFGKDRISLNTQSYAGVKVRYEFYESGTNNPVEVAGFMTINDLDCSQYMQLDKETSDKVTKVYVSSKNNNAQLEDINGELRFYDATNKDVNPDNQDHSFTFLYESASSLTFTWGNTKTLKNGGGRERGTENTLIGDYFFYTAKKPVKTATIKPNKQVTDTDESLVTENTLNDATETQTYTITHQVPDEFEDFYYSSYEMADQIAPVFDIDEDSVKVVNEMDEDVTDYFDIIIKDSKMTAVAKSDILKKADFYGTYYYTSFEVTLKADADLTEYLKDDGTYEIPNAVTVTIDKDAQTSDEVITKIPKQEEVTAVPNEISKSILASDGKEVTHYDLLSDEEEITFRGDIKVGDLEAGSPVSIVDELPKGFTYRSFVLKNASGEDVSDQAEASVEGQTVTITLNQDFADTLSNSGMTVDILTAYKHDPAYAGQTFENVMRFLVADKNATSNKVTLAPPADKEVSDLPQTGSDYLRLIGFAGLIIASVLGVLVYVKVRKHRQAK